MANQFTAESYVTDTEAQCSDCKKIKLHKEFHRCSTYKYRKGCAYYCKECACRRSRQNHAGRDHTGKKIKANNNNRENKLWAIEHMGGKCQDCLGVFHPCVYDFHHKDKETKNNNPSYFIKMSKERAMKELDKCVLLCSNCHRVRHFK